MQPIFLTAEWRYLIMANYLIAPEGLASFVPPGTELDFWQGRCYISLVGFLFVNTKVMGLSIPFHRTFEEVNLRFYVRCQEEGQWKRGVVFIKEIVPKRAITAVANTLYGEKYVTMPMRHHWAEDSSRLLVQYDWKPNGRWNSLRVAADRKAAPLEEGSEEQFITEHYWGYTGQPGGASSEYQVEHPSWRIHPVLSYQADCDARQLYGPAFAEAMEEEPTSVFLAEGSEIAVRRGRRLPA
ncbi:MAG: DUF2071 domain-containing protein [Lewinellaceae bacterium]|nr:DUF2071 domain-containing protein [Phaeodactylibacter sp.]MCB9039701.1 DUF2071 domain-containing protein [Lewinellaceae bacterium]